MALSNILGQANLTATKLDTTATVTLEQASGGFAISAIHLKLEAAVPGATQEQFAELAKKAKENCPVSKLLKAEITLDAKLV
jgi:osmotically inducible protein OsmC